MAWLIATFIGGATCGFFIAALLGSAHRGELERERIEAYYQGVRDGEVKAMAHLCAVGPGTEEGE